LDELSRAIKVKDGEVVSHIGLGLSALMFRGSNYTLRKTRCHYGIQAVANTLAGHLSCNLIAEFHVWRVLSFSRLQG